MEIRWLRKWKLWKLNLAISAQQMMLTYSQTRLTNFARLKLTEISASVAEQQIVEPGRLAIAGGMGLRLPLRKLQVDGPVASSGASLLPCHWPDISDTMAGDGLAKTGLGFRKRNSN
ncbi:hypothetical protein ETAA8_53550 [Anatilimnocola aggregata]|uniref:Uncharacterized protein n=1 Tax=Anatilimnocola aggregata TaxID=2528021 RepID=A0A517YJ39_9BACT|nr:hypothetical protein ETAA8_53550 [Anatilimnocola aggregata]